MKPDGWAARIAELQARAARPLARKSASQQSPACNFAAGLSASEVHRVEQGSGFAFPPDLRALLQTALPVGPRFPDWRHGSIEGLLRWFEGPKAGVLFDVEHSAVWLEEWGERPPALAAALAIAAAAVDAAPRLIPVFSHRCLPAEPMQAGNPVLSVHQTDIIYYGSDLADYLRREFLPETAAAAMGACREVRFWSRFMAGP